MSAENEKSMRVLYCVLALLLTFSAALSAAENNKRYEIESGIVLYKLEGANIGAETLVFDNYGLREARRHSSTFTMNDESRKVDLAFILKNGFLYTISATEQKATKKECSGFGDFSSPSGYSANDLKKMDKSEKVGVETILAKKCEIWKVPKQNLKIWLWKELPLKVETELFGRLKTTYTAEKILTDIDPPDKYFEIPDGINFDLKDDKDK